MRDPQYHLTVAAGDRLPAGPQFPIPGERGARRVFRLPGRDLTPGATRR